MRRIALSSIRLYQRHLSPHKGFCCAYRHHTGHASCSELGYRTIRRFGLFDGLDLLRRRLDKCGLAHRRYNETPARRFRHQAGFCDLSCDFDCGDGLLSDCSPCDCGDWGSSRKDEEKDDNTHLPAQRGTRT
jgi:putative component of membrane protein insertase Oxa1/YidC/SpoIIIJ protein YidD